MQDVTGIADPAEPGIDTDLADLFADADVGFHGRVPFRLVVVEGEAKFGELPFQFFALGVEGRVDAGFGVSVERGGEIENAVSGGVIGRIHRVIPFRLRAEPKPRPVDRLTFVF